MMTDKEIIERLSAVLMPDCTYSGNEICIECETHSDAIEKMRKAREALAELYVQSVRAK